MIAAFLDLDVHDLARLAGWAYLVIFGIAAGDAVFPVLPGETAVILGGVLAAQGNLNILGRGRGGCARRRGGRLDLLPARSHRQPAGS